MEQVSCKHIRGRKSLKPLQILASYNSYNTGSMYDAKSSFSEQNRDYMGWKITGLIFGLQPHIQSSRVSSVSELSRVSFIYTITKNGISCIPLARPSTETQDFTVLIQMKFVPLRSES